jgi:hypothetical protein
MEGNGTSVAILIGVWATFALDVFSTLNSSPQTTELNAGARTPSLMYWVSIGSAVAVAGGLLAWIVSKRVYPALATASVSAGMYLLYVHATKRGLAKLDQATESYEGM